METLAHSLRSATSGRQIEIGFSGCLPLSAYNLSTASGIWTRPGLFSNSILFYRQCKKVSGFFYKRTIKVNWLCQLILTCPWGLRAWPYCTGPCPCIWEVLGAAHEARLRSLEGPRLSQGSCREEKRGKYPSRKAQALFSPILVHHQQMDLADSRV